MNDKSFMKNLFVGLLLVGGVMMSGGAYSYGQSAAPAMDKQLEDALRNSPPVTVKPSGPREMVLNLNGVLVEVEPVRQFQSPPTPNEYDLNVSSAVKPVTAVKKAVFTGPQSTDEPGTGAVKAQPKAAGKFTGPQSTDQTPDDIARAAQQKPSGPIVGPQSTDEPVKAETKKP